MPFGRLFISPRHLQHQRFAAIGADDLQAKRQPRTRKAAGNRDGGIAPYIERRGVADVSASQRVEDSRSLFISAVVDGGTGIVGVTRTIHAVERALEYPPAPGQLAPGLNISSSSNLCPAVNAGQCLGLIQFRGSADRLEMVGVRFGGADRAAYRLLLFRPQGQHDIRQAGRQCVEHRERCGGHRADFGDRDSRGKIRAELRHEPPRYLGPNKRRIPRWEI